ncbi:T9SS type A sorting domain-containing protein [Neolewinella aurantiaca]|nr:T9SS type A sorting domain-containing protein [Neolewinella aurantiaca]
MLFSTLHCTRGRAPMLLMVLFVAFTPLLSGQELSRSVVGAAGSYYSEVNVGNIHFTVGEIAVTRSQNGLVLERGFHHGLYELIATSTWSAPAIQLEMSAFPNPTADKVTLTGDWNLRDRLKVSDLLGRLLSDKELPPGQAELDLTSYPSGTYLLTVSRAGQPLKTLRIVRQ